MPKFRVTPHPPLNFVERSPLPHRGVQDTTNPLRRQIRPSEPLRYRRAHQIGAIESGNENSEPLNFGYKRNRSYRASAISGTENAISTQLMGAQAVQRHVGLLLFVTFSFKQRKSLSSPTEQTSCRYFSAAASHRPTKKRNSLCRQIRPSEPLRYNRAHQIGAIESGNEDSEPLNFGYKRNRSYRASAISGTEKAVSTQLMGAQAVQRHVGLLLFVTFSFKQRKSLSSLTEQTSCRHFREQQAAPLPTDIEFPCADGAVRPNRFAPHRHSGGGNLVTPDRISSQKISNF